MLNFYDFYILYFYILTIFFFFHQIDETSGNLVILRRLSISEGYILNISVIDNGGLTAHTVIQANVEDVNDHAPVFAKENYEFRITEGITLKLNKFIH